RLARGCELDDPPQVEAWAGRHEVVDRLLRALRASGGCPVAEVGCSGTGALPGRLRHRVPEADVPVPVLLDGGDAGRIALLDGLGVGGGLGVGEGVACELADEVAERELGRVRAAAGGAP